MKGPATFLITFIVAALLTSTAATAAGSVSPFSVRENDRCSRLIAWYCKRTTKNVDANFNCFKVEFPKCLNDSSYMLGKS